MEKQNPHKQSENKGLVAILRKICGCLTLIHRKTLCTKMRHIIQVVDKLGKDTKQWTVQCKVLSERTTLVKTHLPTETL